MLRRVAEMNQNRDAQPNLQLFTGCILMLSSVSRAALSDVDAFLNDGSYDFHQMRQLNALRRRLAAYAAIADHYHAATARGARR